MLVGIKKSSILSLISTFDSELLSNNFLENSHQCFLFLLNTTRCKKHYWIWYAKMLLGFFQSYLTRCVALKIVACNAIRFLPRWACAMCKFGPFIVWCQAIEFIISYKRPLRTHPSCTSCNFFVHCHVSIMLSFSLFLITFGMGSLLVMTKVGLWLTIVICFR
jgi:hypothetical protein